MSTKAFRYRLTSTGSSSAKFGPCEVCGKHATEVFQQVEEVSYEGGWTQHGCSRLFGHTECLVTKRQHVNQPIRMKWVNEAGVLKSGCGRFEVGGSIWTKGGGCYVRLFDKKTGTEYPCRTMSSAKSGARNLSKHSA